MIGLASLPSAMITRSTGIVSVLPVAIGAAATGLVGRAELHDVEDRGGDEVGAASPRNSAGARSTFSSMPSSSA